MNEYYTRSSSAEYWKYKSNVSTSNIKPYELDAISKYDMKGHTNRAISSQCDIEFKDNQMFGETGTIFIDKYVDEWFFVTIEHPYRKNVIYYKCDQFEGLLKLLDDTVVSPSQIYIRDVKEMNHIKLFEKSFPKDMKHIELFETYNPI